MRTLRIDSTDAGKTFEQYVARRFSLIPKSLYYQYLRKNCFKINGNHVSTGKELLKENDLISFYIEDRYFEKIGKNEKVIDILFENEWMIVADKPEGILSHADDKLHEEDLLHTLSMQKNVALGTYSLVNRLDFNTTGLIIIGKNEEATRRLNEAAQKNQIRKFYRCLVIGYLEKPVDELHAWLLKDEPSALVRISEKYIPKSQEIITKYQVLEEGNGLSLLEVELLTGKTHQIRAHFAAIDHPVLGDPLYGKEVVNKKYGVLRQALWASKLMFDLADPNSPFFEMRGKIIEKNEPFWLKFLKK